MATQPDDDLDMPEWSDDLVPKAVPGQDLHLGAATVRPLGQSWAEQHGPQRPSAGLQTLDFVVLAMFAASVILLFRACSWAITG